MSAQFAALLFIHDSTFVLCAVHPAHISRETSRRIIARGSGACATQHDNNCSWAAECLFVIVYGAELKEYGERGDF